jgi:hypothetical protein
MLDLGRLKNVNDSPSYCVTILQDFCAKDPGPARCRLALRKPPKPPDLPCVIRWGLSYRPAAHWHANYTRVKVIPYCSVYRGSESEVRKLNVPAWDELRIVNRRGLGAGPRDA